MGDTPGSTTDPSPSWKERRAVPRYSFIAEVSMREPETDTRISGRISEISRKGCYVDVLVTLPVGTQLQLHVSRDQGTFKSNGKIIYVQAGMGMGVGFVDTPDDQLKILDAWLAEIAS